MMHYSRRRSGLYETEEAIELPQPPRGACEFMPPFGAPFQAPIATPGGAVTVPWYLAGGVSNTHALAWTPKGAASLAASYLRQGGLALGNANLDPAVVGSGVAPTLGANGWNIDGTQWLDTGIVIPGTQSYSFIVRFSGITTGAPQWMLGVYSGGSIFAGLADYPIDILFAQGATVQQSVPLASGVLAVAGVHCFISGVQQAGDIPADANAQVYTLAIGGLNRGGGVINPFTVGTIEAIAIYDIDVTTQMPAISAAAAAL